ncbi:hypothetical protein F4810DRAFT_433124 [Camillea tinctor]|nr:hypothetical protein F4810DRAFT_433124 [Camillea tinctor]
MPATYKALENQDGDEELLHQRPKHNRYSLVIFAIGFLISSIAISLLVLIFVPSPAGSLSIVTHCGDSAHEATRRGCHFDIMSFSWLPPRCFDEELTHSFDAIQPWEWFSDLEGTQPVSREEVLRGEADALFVSFEYHRAHCTSMWKKLHRAIGNNGYIDSYIGNYNHTVHCEKMLLTTSEQKATLDTRIFRKFPTCNEKTVYF